MFAETHSTTTGTIPKALAAKAEAIDPATPGVFASLWGWTTNPACKQRWEDSRKQRSKNLHAEFPPA
jgi:hypothetical protein